MSYCPRCNRDVIPDEALKTFGRAADKKALTFSEENRWCLDCRRREFASRLVGEDRRPVSAPPPGIPEKDVTGAEIVEKRRKICIYYLWTAADL